jgi:HD-GYP domain-containing protein (c-di-GMP phosphodiesterase class II)
MSVFSPRPEAAPVYGAAVAQGRLAQWVLWLRQGRGNALGIALAAGLLGELVSGWGAPPLVPTLPFTPFVSCAAGLLLGWQGVAAASLGQLLAIWMSRGNAWEALVLAACLALLGIAAHLVFRSIPKLGRGLPNLRSYLWLLGCALFGGLLAAGIGNLLLPQPLNTIWIWTRAAGSLVSVLLLVPPLLLVADRHLRPWIVPIPGEMPARRVRRFGEVVVEGEVNAEATVMLERNRPPEVSRGLLVGAGLVLGISVLVVPLVALIPEVGGWLRLLYLIPILWAALAFGLRGGVLAASASGFAYLLGIALVAAAAEPAEGARTLWSAYADLCAMGLTGAFVGRSREREFHLRQELADSNRLLRCDILRVARALTAAVQAKDAYTEGHLHRVSEYAVTVGERLGLRGQDLEMLHYASLLHDIGKIGISEQVLQKPGPLMKEEADAMRRHPEIGARMLENLDILSGAAPLVLHHQERYDGRRNGEYPGYPGGLAGDRIPLGARIIAVVDAFDAMTTNRPYRRALSPQHAIAVLQKERGQQFDPRVVDAFVSLLAERPWEG